MAHKQATASSRELSADKLKELKENAAGILAEARRTMMNRQPFVGAIAMNLAIVPVRDGRLETAATDGKSIFFDIDFLSQLTPDEQLFVLAHEVWHNVMLHFARNENRDRELFNIATDLEVNQILVQDGFCVPADGLMPAKMTPPMPEGKSAEEYYEILKSRQGKGQGNGGGQSGGGQSGGGQGRSKPCAGQFDKHIYNGDAEEQGPGNTADKYGKLGTDPDYQPSSQISQQVEKIREFAVSAAQQMERSRGTLPAHIAAIVNKLVEPEVNWREMLQQFVTRCYGDRREWNPPNRRHVWHGSYMQSRRGEKVRIAVGLDTSGSTAAILPKFLGELNGLVKSFGRYELTLIQCDAKVQRVDTYSPDCELDLENQEFEMAGGGGTELHPIFDYIAENDLEVDAAVILTDGYTESFPASDDPGYPVMWMIAKGGEKSPYEFGEVVEFNEDGSEAA